MKFFLATLAIALVSTDLVGARIVGRELQTTEGPSGTVSPSVVDTIIDTEIFMTDSPSEVIMSALELPPLQTICKKVMDDIALCATACEPAICCFEGPDCGTEINCLEWDSCKFLYPV